MLNERILIPNIPKLGNFVGFYSKNCDAIHVNLFVGRRHAVKVTSLGTGALPTANDPVTLLINVLDIVESVRNPVEKTTNKSLGSFSSNNVMGINMADIRIGQNLVKQINAFLVINGIKLKRSLDSRRCHDEFREGIGSH